MGTHTPVRLRARAPSLYPSSQRISNARRARASASSSTRQAVWSRTTWRRCTRVRRPNRPNSPLCSSMAHLHLQPSRFNAVRATTLARMVRRMASPRSSSTVLVLGVPQCTMRPHRRSSSHRMRLPCSSKGTAHLLLNRHTRRDARRKCTSSHRRATGSRLQRLRARSCSAGRR